MNYRMQIHSELSQIPQQTWNSLLLASNCGILHPALRHEYLCALEQSCSVAAETGWAPVHISLLNEKNEILAAIPMYLKSHSSGEYVFDWAWAQAYERNGLAYYPKLLSAIPFTPVLGPKLLALDQNARELMAVALKQFCSECASDNSPLGVQVSSFHGLFLPESDQEVLLGPGSDLMSRQVVQFHWFNSDPVTKAPFPNFDSFLESLNRKKRKNIKAERRKVEDAGVQVRWKIGQEISQDEIEFFYRCYAKTYAEHFSSPYLNLDFFRRMLYTMPEQLFMVIASLDGQDIASSFFLFNEERLYGRYWGAIQSLPCLHFELCYYQAIEFAISRGIEWFEGGAQGEHKMARGLNPTTQISAHWIADAGFVKPIQKYLEREASHLDGYVDELREHQAFKALTEQNQ